MTLVPTHTLELVEAAAARRSALAGRVESRTPPSKPLDVLVQHLVTVALGGGFTPEALYDEVRMAPSYAAPNTSPPDANYTTGAGLSSATHRTQHPPARRSALWMVLGATLIAGLAAAVGVVAARTPRGGTDGSRGANARNTGAEGPREAANGATSASVGANGANVIVRTTPAGASVRDAVSGEVLCDQTPCMVPVAAGRQRRVRLALGTASMEAVLDPAVSLLSVPLGPEPGATAGATTAGATVSAAEPDAGARRATRTVNTGRRTSGNTGTSGRNSNANNNHSGGGDIPMFGVRPGGG